MRTASFAAALLCAFASLAHAQTSTSQCVAASGEPVGYYPGSATTFTLSVDQSATQFTTIAPTVINDVLDLAECECDSQDLYIHALVSSAITVNPLPAFSVWEGNDCNSTSSNRATMCEQVTDDAVNETCFSSTTSNDCTVTRQRVHVQALISPLAPAGSTTTTAHMCVPGQVNNAVWFLFNNPEMPDYCEVQLNYYGTPPPPPTNVTAGSGDGAISLAWTGAAQGTNDAPAAYQVLCADQNFNPIPGAGAYAFAQTATGHPLGYSTCVNPATHDIQRQVLATTGTVATDDGGVISTVDLLTTTSEPLNNQTEPGGLGTGNQPLDPQDSPADMGTLTCPSLDTDGGVASAIGNNQANATLFNKLDKRFVCSDPIGSSSVAARIDGLTNNAIYYFMVVAIDSYGNPAPSPIVCGQPQPVETPYRRFLADGGKPQGFCFIATAAFGSYENPFVMALRDFRDQVLLPTDLGARFVAWYYRHSPPAADWIRTRSWARFAVRMALWPVITFAVLWLEMPPPVLVLLGCLAFALFYSRRLRKSRRPASAPLATAGSEA